MSYQTETYATSIDVKVTFTYNGEVESFEDAHKGLNVGHAMWRAQQNWPGAEIELLGITRAGRDQEGRPEVSMQPEVGRARRSDAGQPRATERDALGMSWVVEMAGMPLDLLKVATGGMSEPASRKMIRRWRMAGWAETRKLDSGPIWIIATRLGVEMFGRHAYDVRPPSLGKLDHLRQTIAVRIWFERQIAADGADARWVSERELRWEMAEAIKDVAPANRAAYASAVRSHVVDGVVEYLEDGKPVRMAVEVELSPKAIDVLIANMARGADTHTLAHWFVNDRTRALVERAKADPRVTRAERVRVREMDDVYRLIEEETP